MSCTREIPLLTSDIVRDQLHLASTASAFDLSRPEERLRSAEALTGLFLHLQSSIRPKVCAEIGAYDARFSRAMKAQQPSAQVFAFEGSPENHAHFAGVYDFSTLGVDYRHILVSDIDGFTDLMVQTKWDGEDALKLRGNDSLLVQTRSGVEYEPKRLPSVRLDSFFDKSRFSSCDYALWIDVEGGFEKVYRGGLQTLSRTRSLLVEVEEYSHWAGQWLFSDVHAALAELGFFPVARDFEYVGQFNVVFLHKSVTTDHLVQSALTGYYSSIVKRAG